MYMRLFKISNTHSEPKENISNIIEQHFGDITEMNDNTYKITNPLHSILEEIYIEVDYEKNTLKLDIQEKDISQIKSENLLNSVPETVNSKNKFLKKVTGTTVSDRKQKWRKEVLPTDENMIRYNWNSIQKY